MSGTLACDGTENPVEQNVMLDINKNDDIVIRVQYLKKIACTGNNKYQSFYYFYTKESSDSEFNDGYEYTNLQPGARVALSPYNVNIIYTENRFRRAVKSTNAGMSFNSMGNGQTHVDIRWIHAYDGAPTDPAQDEIYLCTDGGLARTVNGNTWIDITGQGMACTNYYGLGITEQNSDYFFAGAQDGSINFYNEGTWYETSPGGDNGDCLIKIDDQDHIIQENQLSA